MTSICPACGFPGDYDGPVHKYLSPSPACWARYGEVLAREYSDRDYWPVHRLLTDAYCGQHSIGEDRRARQSLYLHLTGLMLHFEDRAANETIIAFLRKASKSDHVFPHLSTPQANFDVSITEVHNAADAVSHGKAAGTYARRVYDAWAPHHSKFRALFEEVRAS